MTTVSRSLCKLLRSQSVCGFVALRSAWLSVLVVWSAPAVFGQKPIDFTRDIRPLLSNSCFQCHGPDEESREADLRLDRKEGLFRDVDGYAIVKPEHPSNSELVNRILSDDPDVMMPPPSANKPLSEKQTQLLVEWIRQGASWEEHWAFRPPQQTNPPQVNDSSWTQNEIDQFLLASMQQQNLQPNGIAGPYTLVRRLYLDLIGLQPTPEQADEWVSKLGGRVGSNQPVAINEDAYQQLISELFQSPHYGERWARRWLDLARYADTNGYEKDRERSIWPYRDWVIQAFNNHMPFDRFTIEQLAGDMLPDASLDQRIATGFHRNTMLNEEGGIDPLEFRFHAMTDRVATTGTTWLGLTLGCCQCHTHKYDPISHHEYFQVMAFLNNADEPTLEIPDSEFQQQWEQNLAKAEQLLEELPNRWPVADTATIDATITDTQLSGAQNATVAGPSVTISGDNPATANYVVDFTLPSADYEYLKLVMETSDGAAGPGRTKHGNFVLNDVRLWQLSEDDATTPIELHQAEASVEQEGFPASAAIDDDPESGWAIHAKGQIPKSVELKLTPAHSLDSTEPLRLRLSLVQHYGHQHTIGAFRIQAVQKLSEAEVGKQRTMRREAAFQRWLKAEQQHAVEWDVLKPVAATSNLPILTIEDDRSIFASGDTAKRDDYYISFDGSDTSITALRLEALPDERLPERGPGSTYYEGTLGDFYLTEFQAMAGDQKFPFSSASETFAANRFGSNPVSAALAIDQDVQTGWSVHGRQGERHVAVFVLKDPIPAETAFQVQMTFGRHFASSLGRFRLSATDSESQPEARTYSDHVAACIRRGDCDDPQVRTEFLLASKELAPEAERIRSLQKPPEADTTLVLSERPAGHDRPTYRHHRGEFLQPRDEVQAALPEVLNQTGQQPSNRLEFARWLVSRDNPLTARVVVNRQWAAFFGEGIVRTLDDFGLQGQAPTHPELLDWLAVTFRDHDQWSLQKLQRRIVSSAAYRQGAGASQAAVEGDPDNRLLSHFPRFRLDAEIVRDQLLVSAGVLSRTVGGPSVRPPQPAGITEVTFGSPKWNPNDGPDRFRRSLYTFSKRTAPFAMYSTFDAPTGEACIAQRNRSNSPLQALTLLNDVMVMELAGKAGERYQDVASKTSDADGLQQLFRSLLVRPPTDYEMQLMTEFLEKARRNFSEDAAASRDLLSVTRSGGGKSEGSDAAVADAETAAWTAVARIIFALDETQSRE